MSKTASLLSITILAIAAAAAPLPQAPPDAPSATLPIQVHFDLSNGKLPDQDRARVAQFLKQSTSSLNASPADPHTKRTSTSPLSNGGAFYVADVSIGTPPTTYSLLVDTGSANTWVGAGKKFTPTSSSVNTGHRVTLQYGIGSVSGTEYTDTVSLSPELSIEAQSIGVVSKSFPFGNLDGMLGVGPTDLTRGTVEGVDEVPTVSDNLFSQHKISSEILGISFNPFLGMSSKDGQLTFGGVDSSKFTGSITYAPLTLTQPSANYWGVDAQVAYGNNLVLPATKGIVDTGSSLVLLASDAYKLYQQQTGGSFDYPTGLLKITSEQYKNLKSLYFTVGGTSFELTPNAQIWPRSLNRYIGGSRDGIYLVVTDMGIENVAGMDFVLGYTFLERFYSVFDTANHRIGLATTSHTTAISN